MVVIVAVAVVVTVAVVVVIEIMVFMVLVLAVFEYSMSAMNDGIESCMELREGIRRSTYEIVHNGIICDMRGNRYERGNI